MLTERSTTSFTYYYLKSFFDTLVEYFKNCSVPGYKYLVGRNKYERYAISQKYNNIDMTFSNLKKQLLCKHWTILLLLQLNL